MNGGNIKDLRSIVNVEIPTLETDSGVTNSSTKEHSMKKKAKRATILNKSKIFKDMGARTIWSVHDICVDQGLNPAKASPRVRRSLYRGERAVRPMFERVDGKQHQCPAYALWRRIEREPRR